MSSLEVRHLQNGMSDSLDSSEYSIISDQPMMNGDIIENGFMNGNFDLTNLHSALMSATPDLSLEELQSHIANVVEDNVSLRELLKRNNDMMQQQLNTIAEWHNQMTTSMSNQQLDLKEAENKIMNLEKEKEMLLKRINEVETESKTFVDCGISMDNVAVDEEGDFEIVSRKNKSEENKIKEADTKIAELLKIIEEQNKQIEILKQQNECKVQHSEKCTELVGDRIKSSSTLHSTFTRELEKKLDEVKQSLALKDAELNDEKTCHLETKKMFNTVQTNYDRVTKLLQVQSKDEREKSDIEREMDTKMYLEQIDKVTAELYETKQKLEEEKTKVESLEVELTSLKEESESIPILKAQIEIYQSECDSATLEKQAAVEEVSRLTRQLLDASSVSLCDSCGGNMSGSAESSRGNRKTSSSHKKTEVKHVDGMYRCPLCKRCFTTLQAVEIHASDCNDKTSTDRKPKFNAWPKI